MYTTDRKPEGVLLVTVIEAKKLAKKDFISKNDPYVELWLEDDSRQTTRVIDNTNNPLWNSQFTFPIEENRPRNKVHFRVFDQDYIGKDLIGEASVEFEQVADAPSMDVWITLRNRKNEKKSQGELHVGLEFRAS